MMTSGSILNNAANMPKINIISPKTVQRIFNPNPGDPNISDKSPCAKKKLKIIGTNPRTINAIPAIIGTMLYPKNFNACFNAMLYLTNLDHSLIIDSITYIIHKTEQ